MPLPANTKIEVSDSLITFRTPLSGMVRVIRVMRMGDHLRLLAFTEGGEGGRWEVMPVSLWEDEIEEVFERARKLFNNLILKYGKEKPPV